MCKLHKNRQQLLSGSPAVQNEKIRSTGTNYVPMQENGVTCATDDWHMRQKTGEQNRMFLCAFTFIPRIKKIFQHKPQVKIEGSRKMRNEAKKCRTKRRVRAELARSLLPIFIRSSAGNRTAMRNRLRKPARIVQMQEEGLK